MTDLKHNKAFNALHAVYHERDFRVRVNDPTINFVRRILAESVGVELRKDASCPACEVGFDWSAEQPNAEDRRR